ncbi:MAG: OmpA family protein [Deinococcales bacterium]|nr:OmpA family protein [Chitinophagaceae bacterium]
MKKIVLLFVIMASAISSFSQSTDLKKRPTLSIGFNLKDFKTANLIRTKSLSDVLVNKSYARIEEMAPGLNVSYFQGITDHIDFMGTLGACFSTYEYKSKPLTNGESFLLDLDAHLNFKLLTDNYFLVPYITVGIGGSMYKGTYFMANTIGGVGLQFKLGEGSFINLQSSYKVGISEYAKDNLNYTLGFASPLVDKKVTPIVAPPAAPIIVAPVQEADTDNDGIVDSKDKCPTVAGVAKYEGCPVPDTDNDGINDDNDKCPTVAGFARYDGCPIPDTDGDGVNDEEDKCKTVFGLARYQGCPIPDTDGDGVNDEEDKCPLVAGVKENAGCPIIKEEVVKKVTTSAKNIFFANGKAILLVKSYKSLDAVVAILKEDSALKLDIEGHTSSTGSDKINVPLSKDRAAAVYNYIIKNGIDASKLTSEGYGSSKPVADNKTAKGQALNRRVEMKLRYY